MIAGIEGRHAWTPPDAGAAAVVLGRVLDDAGKAVWPHYKLDSVSGLHSLGDSEDNRDKKVGQIGENPRLSQRRGKTITYEGWIRARSLKSLREADSDLREAFAEQSGEGRMDVSWHPLNAEFAGEEARFYEARALGVEIIDTQQSMRYERKFLVVVRTSDPGYFENVTFKVADVVNTGTVYDFA